MQTKLKQRARKVHRDRPADNVRFPQHSSHWHPLISSTEAVVGSEKMRVERMAGFVTSD